MSPGQTSITAFFRKNQALTNPQVSNTASVPQPRLSPPSLASCASTPAVQARAKHVKKECDSQSSTFRSECDSTSPFSRKSYPKCEVKLSTPSSATSPADDDVPSNKQNQIEDIVQSTPVACKIDRSLKRSVSRRRASARQATKLVGSMHETSSESELESEEVNESDSENCKSTTNKRRRDKVSQNLTRSRQKSSKAPRRCSVESDAHGEDHSLDFGHLRYQRPESSTMKATTKSEVPMISRSCDSKGRRITHISNSNLQIEEESPVLERIRQWKEECEQKAETELWDELSRVEAELDNDASGSVLDTGEKSLDGKSNNQNKSQSESTYELERLENIRRNNEFLMTLGIDGISMSETKPAKNRSRSSRRPPSPTPARSIPTRRSQRSSSAAADRDMKLQEASSLEQELEALMAQNGGSVDADLEAEYRTRIEALRRDAALISERATAMSVRSAAHCAADEGEEEEAAVVEYDDSTVKKRVPAP